MKRFFTIVSAIMLLSTTFATAVAQQRVPEGSYRQTCQDTRVEGDMLKALCEKRSKQLVPAELKLPCYGYVGNTDGKLICHEDPRKIPPPPGSYRRFCRDFANYKVMLEAQCRSSDPKSRDFTYKRTQLPLPCNGDIAVDYDGKLICKT